MAQRTQVLLIDDIDGTEITDGSGQTITFAVGNTTYEIDLSDENLGKFYDVLQPYTDSARKVGGGRGSSSRTSSVSSTRNDPAQLQAMRTWAKENGYKVSERGRISKEVQDAYNATH